MMIKMLKDMWGINNEAELVLEPLVSKGCSVIRVISYNKVFIIMTLYIISVSNNIVYIRDAFWTA